MGENDKRLTAEALNTAVRLNATAKRGKADGRVFIDYRDWEAFMAEVRAALLAVSGEASQ